MEGATDVDPEAKADPVSLKVEGDTLFQEADISGALRLWRQALSLAEEKVGATNDNLQHTLRMNLVRGYTRRTDWSSVLEWCNAAIAVGSKDSKAYHWRAIALGRHSKWDEAEAAIQDYLAVGGDAGIAARTRKEWERCRNAKQEQPPPSVDMPVADGLRQRSVAVASKATEGSTNADVNNGARKLMGGSGKSLTAGYISADSSQAPGGPTRWSRTDLLYLLCPLNWDRRTYHLIAIVSVFSWVVGLGFGWCLRREIVNSGTVNSTVSSE
eukprot:gnl/MRDRNA2_/MRDRNA2_125055_c0_seq1.p1 gnl/MRDRNA2_/MRDRNA2_125055_c0~~gnl/MRDRNA2_/MRDRNA2_125055_c0_seq1.p1  ORF type:complete len:270 (+),score=45.31 gnl/MRDRNA2_/MRDRNA2_125055_c0_seq1:107-916(+)